MEYRVVKKGQKVLVYQEETSQQICNIRSQKHFLFFKKYILEFKNKTAIVKPTLLTSRRWKIGDVLVKFKWPLLGKSVVIVDGSKKYYSNGFENGKLKFKEIDSGRTGFIIDKNQLVSEDSVIIEHYERFSLEVSLITALLCMKRFGKW